MKRSVGIAVDGIELKAVHIVREEKQLKIVSLLKDNLVSRVDVSEDEGKAKDEVSLKEIFGAGEAAASHPDQETEDNSSVLLKAIGDATFRGSAIALNLSESSVFFHEMDPVQLGKKMHRLSKKNLLKKIGEQLKEKGEGEEKLRELDCFRTDAGNIVAISYDPPGELLGQVSDARSFIGAKFKVSLVDPNMIALANLVRAGKPDAEKVEAVVYIGREFSRVLFFRGGDHLRFSRVINEGSDSPQILETIYSRMIFEQDEAGITELNHIALAGDVVRLGAKDFFSAKLSTATVDYLVPAELDLSALSDAERDSICEYAIPIGLAWKAIEPRHPGFYPTNLLPAQVMEMEKLVRITWQHIAIAALSVLMAFFLAGKYILISSDVNSRKTSIRQLDVQISRTKPLLSEVDITEARLASLGRTAAQLDVLEKSTPKWTPLFSRMAQGTADLKGIWFNEFSAGDAGIVLSGRAMFRNRVSSFSKYLEKPKLGEVHRGKIRDKEVYSFTYEAGKPGGNK